MEYGGEICSVGLENELLHYSEEDYLRGWLRCTFRDDFTERLFFYLLSLGSSK